MSELTKYLEQLAKEKQIVISYDPKPGWAIVSQPNSRVKLTTRNNGREFGINAEDAAGTYSIGDAWNLRNEFVKAVEIAGRLNQLIATDSEL